MAELYAQFLLSVNFRFFYTHGFPQVTLTFFYYFVRIGNGTLAGGWSGRSGKNQTPRWRNHGEEVAARSRCRSHGGNGKRELEGRRDDELTADGSARSPEPSFRRGQAPAERGPPFFVLQTSKTRLIQVARSSESPASTGL